MTCLPLIYPWMIYLSLILSHRRRLRDYYHHCELEESHPLSCWCPYWFAQVSSPSYCFHPWNHYRHRMQRDYGFDCLGTNWGWEKSRRLHCQNFSEPSFRCYSHLTHFELRCSLNGSSSLASLTSNRGFGSAAPNSQNESSPLGWLLWSSRRATKPTQTGEQLAVGRGQF